MLQMYECECGKKYSYKHSLLHHSRFLCKLLTSPVLTTTRRSEQETSPQIDCEGKIDDGVAVVEEGVGGKGDMERETLDGIFLVRGEIVSITRWELLEVLRTGKVYWT